MHATTLTVPRRKRTWLMPTVLLVLCVGAISAGLWITVTTQRTETVVVWARPVAAGQQVVAEDLATVALPVVRPATLPVTYDPAAVIGRWLTRSVGAQELVAPDQLQAAAPTQPFYPNGATLPEGMVAVPFSLQTVGPVSDHDTINVNVLAPEGAPDRCQALGAAPQPQVAEVAMPDLLEAPALDAYGNPLPMTCRVVPQLRVLYVDSAKQIAYLAATPYQSQVIYTLSADPTVRLYGERYGALAPPLPYLTQLNPLTIDPQLLTGPVSSTTPLLPGLWPPVAQAEAVTK